MADSRRDFLKKAIGASTLLSLGPAVPPLLARTARAAALPGDGRDTVLIVLQLSGGNDGLNTLVPYADDEYGRNRQTLRLSGEQVHKVDDYLGFHPEMKAAARLFEKGQLGVVQGVGYPKSDRSHPGALRNWHTARPAEANCPTGWLGRAIDTAWQPGDADLPGLFVGPIAQPFALNAERAVVPSIRTADQLLLRTPGVDAPAHHRRLLAAAQAGRTDTDNPLVELVRSSTVAAHATNKQVQQALGSPGTTSDYPPFQLANRFKTVAELIRARLGIRIYFVELGGGGIGGFDNHAGQRDNHAALLKQLSDSLAALVDDLARDGQLDRVVLMTFSEFGRTLAENGRRGTGHGEAQPILLAGGKLKGGLIGDHPSLSDLDQGAPKHHTDFRRLYATMLETWLGLDAKAVLGETYEPLELFEIS